MRVLLIGCGHMGSALLRSFQKNTHISLLEVLDPSCGAYGPKIYTELDQIECTYDVLVIALRTDAYLKAKLSHLVEPGGTVISVMASITEDQLKKDFPEHQLIRAMPNIAVAYEQGVTILDAVTAVNRENVERIFLHTGKLLWVDSEKELHILTIFNGCGPGILLSFLQEMIHACNLKGFSEEVSEAVMRQVFIGAATHLSHKHDSSVNDLISSIATPNGITEACIKSLKSSDLKISVNNSVETGLREIQKCR